MWRNVRILILLLILAFVAFNTYFDRVYSTDWDTPLRVAVYPINGDGSEQAERFISERSADPFLPIERFFAEEAAHYGVTLEQPVRFYGGPQLREPPPALPLRSNVLRVMLWSLRTRWYAWRAPDIAGPPPDIKLFALYYDPQRMRALPHSTGLQKGLVGIVHLFADRRMLGANDVVIAHELLHTLGAIDKYDLSTNLPLYPVGYAEPDREPRYPQTHAELMGGRVPLAADEAHTPESLRSVVIGPLTAAEIGWIEQ